MNKYLIVLCFFTILSCGTKRVYKAVFLDFKFGNSHKEVQLIKDSLVQIQKLKFSYIENFSGNVYMYSFGLPNNSIDGILTLKFTADKLYSIWIELGRMTYNNFNDKVIKSQVDDLLYIFKDKYGSFKMEKRIMPILDTNMIPSNLVCYVWDKGYYEIIFYSGNVQSFEPNSEDQPFIIGETSSKIYTSDRPFIIFELKEQEQRKLEKDYLDEKNKEF